MIYHLLTNLISLAIFNYMNEHVFNWRFIDLLRNDFITGVCIIFTINYLSIYFCVVIMWATEQLFIVLS